MVKVLENKLVDLDVLPGQEQVDLQKRLRDEMQKAKGAAGQAGDNGKLELPKDTKVVKGEKGAEIAKQQGFQVPQDAQGGGAKGFGGVVLDGSGKVISGLSGTVGGVLKGVGDTAGNAVRLLALRCGLRNPYLSCSQVVGLSNTGTGLVSVLANTAKAPFSGNATSASTSDAQPQTTPALDADVPPEKRKPKKIERRGGEGVPAAEPDAAGRTVGD